MIDEVNATSDSQRCASVGGRMDHPIGTIIIVSDLVGEECVFDGHARGVDQHAASVKSAEAEPPQRRSPVVHTLIRGS